MDKKNAIFGTIFIVAAAVCYYISYRFYPQHANPAAVHAAAVAAPTAEAANTPPTITGPNPQTEFAAVASEKAEARVVRLQNAFIDVAFTNYGAAIRNVALEKYPAALHGTQPFILNELHKDPIGAFVALPGLDATAGYQIVSQTNREVVFRTRWANQLEVTRKYVLSPDTASTTGDPYLIRTETTFRNLTAGTVSVPNLQIAIGTAAPVDLQDRGLQLNTIGYRDGKAIFTARSALEASNGFFSTGLGAHPALPQVDEAGPMIWGAVSNQFFVSIFTPDQPAGTLVTRRVKLLSKLPDTDNSAYGVTADAVITLPAIAPHAQATVAGTIYVGPKEYHRLSNVDVFNKDQDRVMNFGWWIIRLCAALLLTLMTWMHGLVSNWGLAIVLTTLLLKVVFVPFTLAASRSAKRMATLQPQMKAIKEKYKDNPQKQQLATMELFKENKVNPVGGCLPMLITLPFFWGFYSMLRSAAELRFQPFLWATDLTAPDTIAHPFGFPLNIFPLLFTATLLLQMQLTPQPSVDNSQAKMMKFMPLVTLFIYYPFSCALSLYSTVNALFTIGQQVMINRMKDPEPKVATKPGRGPGGKALKNVTPRRT